MKLYQFEDLVPDKINSDGNQANDLIQAQRICYYFFATPLVEYYMLK